MARGLRRARHAALRERDIGVGVACVGDGALPVAYEVRAIVGEPILPAIVGTGRGGRRGLHLERALHPGASGEGDEAGDGSG